jgi:hypothetical protein
MSPAARTRHAPPHRSSRHNVFRISRFARRPRPARAGIAIASEAVKERIMTVKITPNDKGTPPGKLAEAEVHFEDGYFQGLKLVGFAVWERRSGNGRNVTFPARSYSVNGERRSFALLRPITDSTAQDRVRDLILQAYREHEEQLAVAE